MPKVLRRKKSLISADGKVFPAYCRKCCKTKSSKEFYLATDKFIDQNGIMSVCRECIGEIYVGQYNVEHSVERALYKCCRILNVLYTESAAQATVTQLKNKEKLGDDLTVFGIYKAKLLSTMRGSDSIDKGGHGGDLTFQYENASMPERSDPVDFTGSESVIEQWGDGLTPDEYRFLEKTLAEWEKSYSHQNKAERFFMKQICLKELELENARKEGKSPDSILKSMQELLKNGALTPAQQTAASSGKGVETWGMFIKNIEETTPAEYYKNKEMFRDFEGIEEYIARFITRPLKNFVTGSRDFNISEEDGTEYDEPNLEVFDEPETGKT